jgi:hypothetical protein
VARSITDRDQERALAAVVGAFAAAGDLERAEAVAGSITDPYEQVGAWAAVVGADRC